MNNALFAQYTLFIINACIIVVKSWSTVSTTDTVVQVDYLAIAPG